MAEVWPPADSGLAADSVSRVELVELYHLAPGLAARRDSVGSWRPSTGASRWTSLSIYERRSDFSGLTLRVAVKEVRSSRSHVRPDSGDSEMGGEVGPVTCQT